MDNSYFSKATGLLVGLARAPQHIPSYLRHLPFWASQPIDHEIPWISFGALDFLRKYVRPSHRVFEYGGGGSTLWFARRARAVLTMENHPDWHRTLTAKLVKRGFSNTTCELHVLSGDTPLAFERDPFFRRIESGTWDIILVDCYCGHDASRYGFTRPFALDLAFKQLSPGGIIVLDDSWMFRELLGPRPGWRITDFISPGPCRYGVTSTAIFEKLP
jgi:hypothetical protein